MLLLRLGLAVTLVVLALPARAQFPDRTVRIVVPFDAGGTIDAVARALAQKLNEKWTVPVIVENRPGAGNTIGAAAVAKASPDGSTLLFANTSVSVNPSLFKTLPYDTLRELAPVVYLSPSPNVLLGQKSLGVHFVSRAAGARQGARRQSAELRFGRQGQRASFLHGAAQERGGRVAAARAVSRRRAGRAGGQPRRGRPLLQRHPRRVDVAARRQGPCARHHQPHPLAGVAGRAAVRRGRAAELFADRLRPHHGDRRHARSNHRQAQRRHQCGDPRAGVRQAVRRLRLRHGRR